MSLICPMCNGVDFGDNDECPFCVGDGIVSWSKMYQWLVGEDLYNRMIEKRSI